MTKPLEIKSEFALLDVLSKSERKRLQQRLNKGPVEIVLKGRLTKVWGNHDGTSQEYEVEVDAVETAG